MMRLRRRSIVHVAAAAAVVALATCAALLGARTALAGGQSIVACSGASTASCAAPGAAASGVYFQVTAGGGNRDFASVEVICAQGYDTVITVEVPAKGSGTSQILYPPPGSCTANLEKQMQIGKARILGTTTFTLT
jgi:hypothetical protein